MAHKKAGSTAKTNRDSNSQRLGVKRYGGEKVISGNIIIRQKGSHYYPGVNTRQGDDYTIYSVAEGMVEFKQKQGKLLVNVI